ncbi:voltage-dependent anion channel-domain-containing protein [Podospora fimiseda]|uniref:RING-type E3 ubiquitin transferase n=1 Tax=Podospora fimiseda TaxID=252190 RepID=A0AAN7BKR5_9PEZI|nr:voltage-dependent anion channel-domain-containing protein [Podospora fimiseda]
MDDPVVPDRHHDAFANPDPARFPNTRLRDPFDWPSHSPPSVSRTKSDADTNRNLEPDTCRICRGEGTSEEPLFYPCRCSGSIKHVHQDCLMEWLSHSQKKHCELCKTPFRFTKLYDPNMPKTLPWHVFTSHMAKLFFTKALVWLRAALVVSVWLGWLPYLMRTVWAFLFWLSDEGVGSYFFFGRQNGTGFDLGAPTTIAASTTCPASPLFPETTTIESKYIPLGPGQLAKSVAVIRDATRGDGSWTTFILRILFGPAGVSEKPVPSAFNTNMTAYAMQRAGPSATNNESLLSGVSFLRNLTRHKSINRVVIATLEGQIVTVLVIVCFILIILVRDYVVQQQPEINMRAAFAAVENEVQAVPQVAPPRPIEVEHVEGPEPERDHLEDDARVAPFRFQDQTGETSEGPGQHRDATLPEASSSGRLGDHPTFGGRALNDADHAVLEYMKIYREAGGDPARILEIAQERNLEVKLESWMQLTRSMLRRADTAGDEPWDLESPTDHTPSSSTEARHDTRNDLGGLRTPDQPLEWDWPSGSQSRHHSKGKERATDEAQDQDESGLGNKVSALRPRANTDGPKISDAIHPLANNSWSFADLPHEPPAASSMFSWNPETESEEIEDTRFTPQSSNDPSSSPANDGFSRTPSPTLPSFDENEAEPAEVEPPLAEPFPLLPQERHDLGPQQQTTQAPVPPPPRRQPAGIGERVADFMWGNLEAVDPEDLAAGDAAFGIDDADDLGDGDDNDDLPEDGVQQDQGAVEAAVAAALDPEAIEDAEDLEGILELLGMRGPVAGLFQNAIFCAFLVSITVFLGIVVPYNVGRITVWTIANPVRPARILFSICMFVQDFALVVVGFAWWAASQSLRVLSQAIRPASVSDYLVGSVSNSRSMMVSAINRVGSSFVAEFTYISGSEIRNFSAISHEALLLLKERVALSFTLAGQAVAYLLGGNYAAKSSEVASIAANASVIAMEGLKELPRLVTNPNSWVLNLSLPAPTAATFNPELAHWSGTDRFWAVAIGYLAMSLMAGIYLRRGSPFFTGPTAQEWEASIIDGLNQASGVMKVILIIGIEMLVFPLYCGMLLDLALLPLFEDTTIKSRLLFTVESPLTSIFVHWFVGTGYMFHFALFGVLYFIRDPDDPEFHPVRDVLERNVTTQLRKILFSAFVYGALVIVCLGGVVWGLALSSSNILPIHYSSNEPVLEFPLDLVFYNFVLPLWFRYSKPSDALHTMYTWWFQKCARMLRVTWFLFGERRIDEEGVLVLPKDSPDHDLPWWRKLFLEVDSEGKVRAMSWSSLFTGDSQKVEPMTSAQVIALSDDKRALVDSNQLIPDGRYVRAPASDQVKIPKGRLTFLNVNEDNTRQDGRQDLREADIYSSDHYQQVYVPPHFRIRVFLFIMFIWIFAAITGVSLTIVPLLFGRWMFKSLIPHHIRTNDIYAFSIGAYILGTAAYAMWHAGSIYAAVKTWASQSARAVVDGQAVWKAIHIGARALKLVYTYTFFYIIFPFLVSALIELYVLIPLHEVRYSPLLRHSVIPPAATTLTAQVGAAADLNPRHTIRLIQTWTIGFLYIKVARRILASQLRNTRPAQALVAVWRRGLGDPDANLFTRAFVVPGVAIWALAISVPLFAASFVVSNGWVEDMVQTSAAAESEHETLRQAYRVLIYRLSFPVVMSFIISAHTLWSMVGLFETYRVRIRDEAYLIGERLHNFGVSVHGGNGTPKQNLPEEPQWGPRRPAPPIPRRSMHRRMSHKFNSDASDIRSTEHHLRNLSSSSSDSDSTRVDENEDIERNASIKSFNPETPEVQDRNHPKDIEASPNAAEQSPTPKDSLQHSHEHPRPKLGIRPRLEHFTWAWYTLSMSTGGLSLLIINQPHKFPALLARSVTHPREGFFVPTFFLSIATLITSTQKYCVGDDVPDGEKMGLRWSIQVAFWVYVALSTCLAVGQYSYIFAGHSFGLQTMMPTWILPIFPVMLSGTIASVIAGTQPAGMAVTIIVSGLSCQGLGISVAVMIGLPDREHRAGLFMCVGPPSFTALAFIGLAKGLPKNFDQDMDGMMDSGVILNMAIAGAGFLWALSFWWFCIAVLAIVQSPPKYFHLGWWASVFPNTGFILATISLGRSFQNEPVLWFATVMSIFLLLTFSFVLYHHVRAVLVQDIMYPGRDEDVEDH